MTGAIRSCAGGVVFYGDEVFLLMSDRGEWVMPKGVIRNCNRSNDVALWRVEDEAGIHAEIIGIAGNTRYDFFSEGRGREISNRIQWFAMRARDPAFHVSYDQGFLDGNYYPVEKARKMLSAQKDVDGCGDLSLAGVFTNTTLGFVPCTAQAAMEILKYYDIQIAGKRAVVIGRSLVVGRPLAMLLMHENATVTVCHTGTCDLKSVLKEADIIVTSTGKMETFGRDHFKRGQTVIDVGIRWSDEKQKLCGDVCFEEVQDLVQAITPVPGGVGSVTSGILALHVAEAAYRSISY